MSLATARRIAKQVGLPYGRGGWASVDVYAL